MPKILNPETKNFFESAMFQTLQTNKTGIFSNEGRCNEPRVVAENVKMICRQEFNNCLPAGTISLNLSDDLSRHSMGDINVTDCDGCNYYIDIITHNLDTNFNMPNITSISRLSKYYSVNNPSSFFLILMIEYNINALGINFQSVQLFAIENISWDCLRIGSLGTGQIQLKNSNTIIIDYKLSREIWMSEFYRQAEIYYANEISKAQERRNDLQVHSSEWK